MPVYFDSWDDPLLVALAHKPPSSRRRPLPPEPPKEGSAIATALGGVGPTTWFLDFLPLGLTETPPAPPSPSTPPPPGPREPELTPPSMVDVGLEAKPTPLPVPNIPQPPLGGEVEVRSPVLLNQQPPRRDLTGIQSALLATPPLYRLARPTGPRYLGRQRRNVGLRSVRVRRY